MLRLFGIVMSKFCIFGEPVDTLELFDFKTNRIRADLPCDLPCYRYLIPLGPNLCRKLIDVCFESTIRTSVLYAIAKSIAAHFDYNTQTEVFPYISP